MEHMNDHVLLQKCVEAIQSHLDDWDDRALRRWWQRQVENVAGLTACLLAAPDSEWQTAIAQHRAHCHPWYDHLAQEASLEEFAAYLLENRTCPGSLPLVKRACQAQISNQGRLALRRKIENEYWPVPRAELMRRFMSAVRTRVGDNVMLESFTTLIHRALVLYHGYYCEPWNLVGALYASEVMTYHQLAQMDAGLVRLGFDCEELEFIRVLLVSDDQNATDWSDEVISPSVRVSPVLRVLIAEGIAAYLETSARYLDDLCIRQIQRAQRGCFALGTQMNWAGSSH